MTLTNDAMIMAARADATDRELRMRDCEFNADGSLVVRYATDEVVEYNTDGSWSMWADDGRLTASGMYAYECGTCRTLKIEAGGEWEETRDDIEGVLYRDFYCADCCQDQRIEEERFSGPEFGGDTDEPPF